jgi:deoxyribodipyrimidine photo-lyase
MKVETAIWWIRRDLRLDDNQSLTAALENAKQVVPVFIIDPKLKNSLYTGEKRRAFLWNGLRCLDADLRQSGSYLVIRQGEPLYELTRLCQEINTHTIFAEQDFSSYARKRDNEVCKLLDLHLVNGLSAIHPRTIMKADNTTYTKYTPFMRAWKAWQLANPEQALPAPQWIETPSGLRTVMLPDQGSDFLAIDFFHGEREAGRRLTDYIQGENAPIYHYDEQRDMLDTDGTSMLSPYLRFGMLSARQAVMAALSAMASTVSPEAFRSAEAWLNELIWREFYVSILYNFPYVQQVGFRPDARYIRWRNDPQEFASWCVGRTGYPVVDAAMRQLAKTGWIHNRARMIVASFLVKDLLIDWHWGERWFMQYLLDGDPASNNGGWQWTAGTGTDAAPYFRIFNPILQSQKFDPCGTYIRRWLPN